MAAATLPRRQRGANTTSENQIKLAKDLIGEIRPINEEWVEQERAEMNRLWLAGECTRHYLSTQIDSLIKFKRTATQISVVRDLPQIPDGRYAITGADGSTDFYRVTNKGGKYKIFLYVSDKQKVVNNWQHAVKVLRQIAIDGIDAASLRWGLEMVRCRDCGAQLTDEGNPYRDLGYGPDCGKKH